jgi:hypothetical protein
LLPTSNSIHAHELARILFQDIPLKVGMCGLIVVDAGSTFCSVFFDACALLGICLHAASRGIHKAVSDECFFRYLNKAVTIASSDRGMNVFRDAASVPLKNDTRRTISIKSAIPSNCKTMRFLRFTLPLL